MDTITCLLKDKFEVIITACDYDKIMQYTWSDWGWGYLTNAKAGSMHSLIIGDRPDDIPKDWVVDHINRNRRDNSRTNLRWVSKDFNSWNSKIEGKTSRFKGVSYCISKKKWLAQCSLKYGHHENERDAALIVAKEAIRKWPLWAPTCDILCGNDLLTKEEIQTIIEQLADETTVVQKNTKKSGLPVGVLLSRNNTYMAYYRDKRIGTYKTIEEAATAYLKRKEQVLSDEYNEYYKTPIERDENGNAIICLSQGKVTLVDDKFWHDLTYKNNWYYAEGYACGRKKRLHQVVYKMYNPNYDDTCKNISIDHINKVPLDNRITNLRVADRNVQNHNKSKRTSKSKYLGVHWNKDEKLWQTAITKNGKVTRGGRYILEEVAAKGYNRVAKLVYGDNAQLNVIPNNILSVGFDNDGVPISIRNQRKLLSSLDIKC